MAHRLTKFIAKGTFGDCRDGATTTREVHWTVATIRAVVLLVLLLPLLLCESVCVYIPKKERGVLRVVLWCGVNLCEIYIGLLAHSGVRSTTHTYTHTQRERERETRGNERTNKQASNQQKQGGEQTANHDNNTVCDLDNHKKAHSFCSLDNPSNDERSLTRAQHKYPTTQERNDRILAPVTTTFLTTLFYN